jgi:hypothetical protein
VKAAAYQISTDRRTNGRDISFASFWIKAAFSLVAYMARAGENHASPQDRKVFAESGL